MNLAEFKAWFEGFTESMDGPPGVKAWERIRERVAGIKAEPTPLPVIYREHPWYRPTWPAYWPTPQWQYLSNSPGSLSAQQNTSQGAASSANQSAAMFADIGRQEAVARMARGE